MWLSMKTCLYQQIATTGILFTRASPLPLKYSADYLKRKDTRIHEHKEKVAIAYFS
jgi:hypothetical protein